MMTSRPCRRLSLPFDVICFQTKQHPRIGSQDSGRSAENSIDYFAEESADISLTDSVDNSADNSADRKQLFQSIILHIRPSVVLSLDADDDGALGKWHFIAAVIDIS